jgi:hypothetical protein
MKGFGMQILNRIDAVSFDPASRRHEAEAAIMLNDDGEVAATASVVGSPQWLSTGSHGNWCLPCAPSLTPERG